MPKVPRVAVLALLLAGGCGAGAGRAPGAGPEAAGGLPLHGARVIVDSAAPFAQHADFPARLESTVAAALAYWGGAWPDLDGATIELTDAPTVECGDLEGALGCLDGRSIRLTVRDPAVGELACVEQTVLVHEIGHAVLGDPDHLDRRWMELEPVQEALAGRVGYTRDGEVPCELYLSVWRHLIGRP